MNPSERIGKLAETDFSDRISSFGSQAAILAIVAYLDEEWKETHCEIPPSTEPGKLHDCSKIHVNSSQNAQPKQQ